MSVLSLADAKTHLNITGTTYDTELTAIIAAAEAAISRRTGPLEPTPVTSRVSGRSSDLRLPVTPVLSITTITPVGGSALSLTGIDVDGPAGFVSYTTGTTFSEWTYTVTYLAGRSVCPDDLKLAIKELVRHFWETQRGGTRRPGSVDQGTPVPGASYAFPTRVAELIAPHVQSFGFA